MTNSENLMWALKNGDFQSFQDLSRNVPNMNDISTNGRSLLHYAADFGQAEICEYLISKGANLNSPDSYGVTPLLAAIYENHIACAKVLLEKGAKLVATPDGSSYLKLAESDNLRSLLQKYGAN